MNRAIQGGVVFVFLACFAMQPVHPSPGKSPRFVPPDVARASDIPYSVTSVASGVVSLLLSLDGEGRLRSTQVLRDVPSLTEPAARTIQGWTFTPAKVDEMPISSNFSVSVVFNPFNPSGRGIAPLALPPPRAVTPEGGTLFTPPEITQASFAVYPARSVSSGAVVLSLTIDKSGAIAHTRVIRDVPSLTAPAMAAVKSWKFSPGALRGQAISAKTVVAVVFRSPLLGRP